jgi:hypothetical protein
MGGNLRWIVDILRTELYRALDLTLSPAAGPTELNRPGMFSLEKFRVYGVR